MITRKLVERGKRVKVTFTLPDGPHPVSVAGDFNDWDSTTTRLRKRGDVRSASITLDSGHRYAFRYVDDAREWFNDEQPDEFEGNGFGDANGIIDLTDHS
jgi:1,4-alpha-glucan branching enzyme